MRTIWRSLMWKEWHEHKWKLVALTAILCGVSAILILATESERSDALVAFVMLAYIVVPLAFFLGAHDAADERGRGTEAFLQSLPVPTWQQAAWKLAFGILTCILPIFLALVVLVGMIYHLPDHRANVATALERASHEFPMLVGKGHSLFGWGAAVGIFASIASVSIYLWTLAFGVGRRDEVRAGAWSLLAIIAAWSIVGFTITWLRSGGPLAIQLVSLAPAGLAMALVMLLGSPREFPVSLPVIVAIGALLHALLAVWFIMRFGRNSVDDRFSPRFARDDAVSARRIGLPRRLPITAIIWKQIRESSPVVMAGLAAIAVFYTANLVVGANYYAQYPAEKMSLLAQLTMFFGFLVALVVGIGIFDRDLGPKVNQFWRSRPIHPDLWFWAKFATGLVVLLVALYLPLLVGAVLSSTSIPVGKNGIGMTFFLQLAIYTSAMAMICLIRQPVYAAILGCGTLLIGVCVVLVLFGEDVLEFESTVFLIEGVTAVLATILAWMAVRYDWGAKN